MYVKVQLMEARGRKREEAGRQKRDKHGQALYTLTPDRPPLAANTGTNTKILVLIPILAAFFP